MPSEEKLNLDGIPITLYRSEKAKKINISIRPFKGVRVAVPRLNSFRQAKQFVVLKKLWIKKHVTQMKQFEDRQTVFNWNTPYKTKYHTLKLIKSKIDIIIYNYTENHLVVKIPENKNILKSDVQDFIVNAIEKTYRLEAKSYLPNRVEELAKTYGLSYNKVKINNAKTRWGSCSSENNINLSLQVMRLPDYLIDYVILHELAHTKVKNHSIHFWDFLDSITDSKAKSLDKELKSFYLQVF
ncbi:MAG: SprT family zinc-dependent metalloprotease [Bacteroidota bacterium]|nr:SprT family zinc-dependent metalloprotease [Bacteroidota bacterium]